MLLGEEWSRSSAKDGQFKHNYIEMFGRQDKYIWEVQLCISF
jgi:hypothetical protein